MSPERVISPRLAAGRGRCLPRGSRSESGARKVHAGPGLPALALIAVGLVVSNTWSLSQVLVRREHPFVRTPKFDLIRGPDGRWPRHGAAGLFRARSSMMTLVELVLALYAGLGVSVALWRSAYGAAPFLALCTAGLVYTAFLSMRDTRRGQSTTEPITELSEN